MVYFWIVGRTITIFANLLEYLTSFAQILIFSVDDKLFHDAMSSASNDKIDFHNACYTYNQMLVREISAGDKHSCIQGKKDLEN